MRIGIDLGGTTVKAALCTEDGTLLCKDSLPTRTGNAAGLKADMKTLALSLCRAHSCAAEDVTAIGIGVPGSFDKKTCTLRFGTNLDLNNVSFADNHVPDLTGNAVAAGVQLAVNDNAAANAGAERYHQHVARALGCTGSRFAERGAVRVVIQMHRPAVHRLQRHCR